MAEVSDGSAVGSAGQVQGEPRSSLPVATCQPVVTLLERAWTQVGTSEQSLFEKR